MGARRSCGDLVLDRNASSTGGILHDLGTGMSRAFGFYEGGVCRHIVAGGLRNVVVIARVSSREPDALLLSTHPRTRTESGLVAGL